MGDLRPDGIFTGLDPCLPAELFTSMIEKDPTTSRSGFLCARAWNLISSDASTPAGLWKGKNGAFGPKTPVADSNDERLWSRMKAELHSAFGRGGKPYSLEEQLELMISLKKRPGEKFSVFLNRVRWVMTEVIEADELVLVKFVFLLGLESEDQRHVVQEVGDRNECYLREVVKTMDAKNAPKLAPVEKTPVAPKSSLTVQTIELPALKTEPAPLTEEVDIEDDEEDEWSEEGEELTAEEMSELSEVKVDPLEGGEQGLNYQCPVCHKKYDKEATCKKHFRTQHGAKPHQCNLCQRRFVWKNKLENHMIRHRNERNFECQYCNKRFFSTGNLREHLIVHTEEKPFECEICFKKFTRRRGLTDHFMIHTGETPYECKQCGEKFRRRDALAEHKVEHTGIEPFSCDLCGMTFRRHGGLKQHMKSHTGERPWQCSICSKSYAAKQGMQVHMRKAHGEESLQEIKD